MKYLRNQEGIALVTAMMFTLLCLAMVSVLIYYVLLGTKLSAAQKAYRNSLEASYGGTEVVTKILIPQLFGGYSTGKLPLLTDYGRSVGLQIAGTGMSSGGSPTSVSGMSSDAVLKEKLDKKYDDWTGPSDSKKVDPKTMPDFIFTLKGTTSVSDFKVYSKIVDTVPGVGLIYKPNASYNLEADGGVAYGGGSSSGGGKTMRTPSIYTIEVQSEAAVNPKEKSNLTVLYAY
jgi:hypothetical protein